MSRFRQKSLLLWKSLDCFLRPKRAICTKLLNKVGLYEAVTLLGSRGSASTTYPVTEPPPQKRCTPSCTAISKKPRQGLALPVPLRCLSLASLLALLTGSPPSPCPSSVERFLHLFVPLSFICRFVHWPCGQCLNAVQDFSYFDIDWCAPPLLPAFLDGP